MSNSKDYQLKVKVALAVPEDNVQEPRIPMGIFLQEAEDLYQIALADSSQLTMAGLPEQLISELPVYCGACREAQSIWMKDLQMRQEAEEAWQTEAPQGYELRDRLLHAFGYAFRKNDALQKRVQAIREGYGHADMIQDLNDLAVLGQQEEALLVQINFDMEQLSHARRLSDELATLLAQSNGERTSPHETKEMRDRMFTLLKGAVDEIRDCGKYVFWKDERKRKQYSSAYERRMRNRLKNEVPVAE